MLIYVVNICIYKKETSMPKIFGWEHITYLIIFVLVAILTIILAKKYLKTEKQQTILIKVIAVMLFMSVIACRIGIAIHNGWKYFLPNTLCSLTSLLFSVIVIFGKPNMKIYHCLWYMALVGGIITLIYPDFIGQNESFFYLDTFTSFLHHSFCILLCVAMLYFNWFKPEIKKSYYFPMVFCLYIVWGLFDIKILKVHDSMSINYPLLSGTCLNCWFILTIGTILVVVFNLIIELIRSIKKKRLKNK